MAKIILAISILVMVGTSVLGFLTKQKVDDMKQNLSAAQQSEQAARAEATKTKGDLAKRTEELSTANKSVEEQKTQITSLEAKVTEATAAAEKASADVRTAKADVERLNAELAAAKTPSSTPQSTPGLDSPETVKLKEDLAKAEQALAEAKTVQETLRNREKEATDRLSSAEAAIRRYQQPIRQQGLTGRVVAVNQGWNFVVLDVGDNRGATVNSPLLVMRNGQVVARLRITSVEPNTSIADVVPGSLPRGQYVQPGDRVVFSGRQSGPAEHTPEAAPTPAAPTTPPPAQS